MALAEVVSQPRFGADGRLIGFIGVATDITVAKEAELSLMQQVVERTAELRRHRTSCARARRWKRSAS